MGWSCQNWPSYFLKNCLWFWNEYTRWTIFLRTKTSLYCLRQSSKSRSTQTIEIKTVSRKFVANQCYFGLSREVIDVILCHWSCHCCAVLWWTLLSFDQSGVVVARATNCMKARQSEAVTVFLFFVALPDINPPSLTKGILSSPQF